MDEEHVVYGGELRVPVPTVSVGILLHKALQQTKERPVLIDAFTGNRSLSTTLFTNACRLGQSLENFGLQKNDIIGVCSENNMYFFYPVLACLFSGITVTTFSPQYREGELAHLADISQPSIIFCSLQASSIVFKIKDRLKKVPKIIIIDHEEDYEGCQSLKNFISEHISKHFDVNAYEPVSVKISDDAAFILYSSGTSGLPKGVVITHLNVNALFALYMDGRYGTTNEPCVCFLPFYHAYGLFLTLRKILFGAYVLVMKKFDPDVYLKTIEHYQIDTLYLVPPIAQLLASTDILRKYDTTSVKFIYCGAAPLSQDVQRTLVKRFNVDYIRQGYGLTESSLGIIGPFVEKKYPYGSVGNVLPGVWVKIVDLQTGNALGPMKSGEICCRGNMVMKGYFRNLKATERTIDDKGWLHTGDIAYYDHNKAFYIVDRLKDMIKCKGYQVAPTELENILLSHPKIADAGVIGIPNERNGEVPFAFVVQAQNQTLSEKEVVDFVADKVAPYKRLQGGVKFVSEIPRTPSGKILHRILRNKLKIVKSSL